MDKTIVWIIVVIVIVLILLALFAMMRKSRREAQRQEAADIRQRLDSQQSGLQQRDAKARETQAQAQAARAEADRHGARADKLEAEAQQHQRKADDVRGQFEQEARRADKLDPDVETDNDGNRVDGTGPGGIGAARDENERGDHHAGTTAGVAGAGAGAGGVAAYEHHKHDEDAAGDAGWHDNSDVPADPYQQSALSGSDTGSDTAYDPGRTGSDFDRGAEAAPLADEGTEADRGAYGGASAGGAAVGGGDLGDGGERHRSDTGWISGQGPDRTGSDDDQQGRGDTGWASDPGVSGQSDAGYGDRADEQGPNRPRSLRDKAAETLKDLRDKRSDR